MSTQFDKSTPIGALPQNQQSMQPPMQPPMQQSMQPPMQQSMQPPMQQSMQSSMQPPMQPPMQASFQQHSIQEQNSPIQKEETRNTLQKADNNSISSTKNIVKDIVSNWKTLLVCFIVLFVVQQEPLQSLARKLLRMAKMPESSLFHISKFGLSLVFVSLFFFTNRNI